MNRITPIAAITLTLAFASGCATLPEPQAAPNGKALSVDGQTSHYTYTTKERVGTVTTSDGQGNSSSSTVYADKKKQGTSYTWSSYQGRSVIADDDLYRIAKDHEAEAEVLDYRTSGVFQNRVGFGVIAAGVLAVAAAAVVYKLQSESDSRALPGGIALGGSLGLSVGMLLVYGGLRKANDPHPLPEERARAAADRYNSTLR